MTKTMRDLILGWGCMLLLLAWGGKEAGRITAALPTPAAHASAADTVTYGDNRIVYTVDVDTATNSDGQLLYIPDLATAPSGMRARYLMKPDFDSVMIITEDTFAMSPTDSATALARSISWGVQDPFLVTLPWRMPDPDPVTNFAVIMSEDTLVSSWDETSGTYQVIGGLNSGPGEDFTDTVSGVGVHKQVVATFGSYYSCVVVLEGGQVSDNRCNNVNYDSVGGGDPPSVNDPIYTENFESWTTTTWRSINGSGGFGVRNPYRLQGDTLDFFIETTGSPEGSNHLRLFRDAKSTAGGGCQNNTIGFQIEGGNSPSYRFGAIMGNGYEFWMEFYVKFDSGGSAPWGTLPDPAWSCSGNNGHKLMRVYIQPSLGGGNFWQFKDGKSANLNWALGAPQTGDSVLQNDITHPGSAAYWDNEWHLFRMHAKRSSVRSALDGIAQFTIDDRADGRILINASKPTFIPFDEVDTWWTSWEYAQFGINRNHWTNHDAQFRFDNIRIWTPTADGGNGGPGWVGDTLGNP